VFKRLRGRERRIVNHELHRIAKEIVEYAKQFPSPAIVWRSSQVLERTSRRVRNSIGGFTPYPSGSYRRWWSTRLSWRELRSDMLTLRIHLRLATGVGTLPTLKEGNITVLSAVSSTTVT